MATTEQTKISYPLDTDHLLRKNRGIRRKLREQLDADPLHVAVLGGSTTAEVVKFIDLFLLQEGIVPEFYESGYNKFFEDAVFDNPQLDEFAPRFVYLHTSSVNISQWPNAFDDDAAIEKLVDETFARFEQVWKSIERKYDATIIQNNFEAPFTRPLGNYDATAISGKTTFVNKLNERFADYSRSHPNFILHDIHYQAAWFGLERWYDRRVWHAYKYAMNTDAFPALGQSVSAQIRAVLGKSKKCLVCDLDNTLWGGVIGDDGVDGIRIGNETPEAASYSELQEYIAALRDRGVILAVNSKNDENNAESGFTHPDSILKRDDFTAFQANWQTKDGNIETIAQEINIGVDALVFIDDNPSERQLVADNVQAVSVPDVGSDISRYVAILDKAGYFEVTSLSREDAERADMYKQNIQRKQTQSRFGDYQEFLASLQMEAEIDEFRGIYLPRIAQLTNKTNQFNLTTKRFSEQELTQHAESDDHITLYGRLADKYGDNGLVSVLLGQKREKALHMELWLMSCRVIKRDFEWAMFHELKKSAADMGCSEIRGYYIPSKKNGMVAEHYGALGFTRVAEHEDGTSEWAYSLPEETTERDIPHHHFKSSLNIKYPLRSNIMSTLATITEIIQDVLDEEDLEITSATTADDAEDWDSLAHIQIIDAIEKEYGMKFSIAEIEEMNQAGDVGGTVDIVERKLAA